MYHPRDGRDGSPWRSRGPARSDVDRPYNALQHTGDGAGLYLGFCLKSIERIEFLFENFLIVGSVFVYLYMCVVVCVPVAVLLLMHVFQHFCLFCVIWFSLCSLFLRNIRSLIFLMNVLAHDI